METAGWHHDGLCEAFKNALLDREVVVRRDRRLRWADYPAARPLTAERVALDRSGR